ncbi:MAG: AmmeMemoRadiSam system protein B [Marinilabiliales bacterium]|nr:AmmeMemoRadiSam system protein B [Marinilabiliales bacterium]
MRNYLWRTCCLMALWMACTNPNPRSGRDNFRSERRPVDTIGFAHLDWQVDSVMARIGRISPADTCHSDTTACWRVAICPHDDYTYVGRSYPAVLRHFRAKHVILFGVAHKARQLNISDKIVFDRYTRWHGPYGPIAVSKLREDLIKRLPSDVAMTSDTLQTVEHSLESMLPILQHLNRDAEILPILVPAMSMERSRLIAGRVASALAEIMKEEHLEWGKDIALLITTDAVHYGDEGWNGKNMAPYGVDSSGYAQAVAREQQIIDSCLTGTMTPEKISLFSASTVRADDYREYRWTWCGRYSLPTGLMVANDLRELLGAKALWGNSLGYSTSIDHKPLPVDDLLMGRTAPANLHHWAGYAAIGYP